jgi:hypothetical protein
LEKRKKAGRLTFPHFKTLQSYSNLKVNEGEYGGYILYSCMKNRTMQPVEIVPRKGVVRDEGELWRR